MILPYKFQFEFEDYLYYDLHIGKKVVYAKRKNFTEYYFCIGKEEYVRRLWQSQTMERKSNII